MWPTAQWKWLSKTTSPVFRERCQGRFDRSGIALVQDAAVTMVGVEDRPRVGIVGLSVPSEAIELLPVPGCRLRRSFQFHFAKFHV